MTTIQLINQTTGRVVLPSAKLCTSFWCHLIGLQFRQSLPQGQGLVFVFKHESIPLTSIHMFNVLFPIGVVWLDSQLQVVDHVLAKPWRPYYASHKPARYFVEANPTILDLVNIGDRLVFLHDNET
ncbi:MAG: DUF192 domain-containing protein [Phototrophicaceae bacterium]